MLCEEVVVDFWEEEVGFLVKVLFWVGYIKGPSILFRDLKVLANSEVGF